MDDLQVTIDPDDPAGRVRLHAVSHLCGPPDVLQGGLATAALARAVVAVNGGTATRVAVRLSQPTPTATPLVVDTEPAPDGDDLAVPGARGTWQAQVSVVGDAAAGATVAGRVALDGRPDDAADHDDLVRIAMRDPLPRQEAIPAAPHCVVCGVQNPHGLHVFPGWFDDGAVAEAWEGDEEVAGPGGMFVRPDVLAAVLDCPTTWACRDHCRREGFGGGLLGGFDVTFHSRLPVGESVRIAAVMDDVDGRKMWARAAVVGADGMLYAVARALQLGVERLPGSDPDLEPFGADLDD